MLIGPPVPRETGGTVSEYNRELTPLLQYIVADSGAQSAMCAQLRHTSGQVDIVWQSEGQECRLPAITANWQSRRRHTDDSALRWREEPEGNYLGISLYSEPDLELLLICRFPHMAPAARAPIENGMETSLPLLREAVRFWFSSVSSRLKARHLAKAIDLTSLGVFVIDQGGWIIHANAEGEALMAEGDGLRRAGATISAVHMRDSVRLTLAIEEFLSEDSGRRDPILLSIDRPDDRPPLMVMVSGSEQDGQRMAILHVLRPDGDVGRMISPVCKLFGLSPVETQVVRCLVDGMTITEAARAMRIKLHTARGYLKHIFDKLDTARQTDLVRMMMGSIIRARSDLTIEAFK